MARDLDTVMHLFLSRRSATPTRLPSASVLEALDAVEFDALDISHTVADAVLPAAGAGDSDAASPRRTLLSHTPRSQDGVEPDFLEYNIVMDACAKAGRLDCLSTVLQVPFEIPLLPPRECTCACVSRVAPVLPPTQDMNMRDVDMTADHYTLAIKTAAVAGDFPLAQRTFEAMKTAGKQPSSATYSAMVSLAMRAGEIHKGYDYFNTCEGRCVLLWWEQHVTHSPIPLPPPLLRSMKRQGLHPTDSMYWSLFDALFDQGNQEHASYVWRNMAAHARFVPSVELCARIILGFSEGDNTVDLRSLLRRMRRRRWGRMIPSSEALRAAFYW